MSKKEYLPDCPVSLENNKILLSHGSGGSLANHLTKEIFQKEFSNEYLDVLHDGAVFEINGTRTAFTTDSFVVKPVFFPGGNIGDLAVNGTVNDLAMCGARPLFISSGFIIEEGFPVEELKTIVKSMKNAADASGVKIITGDTKVVEKGKGDRVFINTTGIGVVEENVNISPARVKPGDKIILSGSIAEHGIAVFLSREELGFNNNIKSDTAAVNGIVQDLISGIRDIHLLRDPTRGGIAGILNEIADSAGVSILIYEDKIIINEEVSAVCELLGFDPLYIANEGKFICILPDEESVKALEIMRSHPLGFQAEIIGEITGVSEAAVILHTTIGTNRVLDKMINDQLPRIC